MPESYQLLIERLKATRLPPALITLHLKSGFHPDETCGTCSAFGEIWLHSTPAPQPYCHQAKAHAVWDSGWPACGKWRAKR